MDSDYPEATPYIPHGASIVGYERLSPTFEKYWLGEGIALHRFSGDERDHEFHDHPMHLTVMVLDGGYIEEVLLPSGGSYLQARQSGLTFVIDADHRHRITKLPTGECWTLCEYGDKVREPAFYRPAGAGVERRQWNSDVWETQV